MKNIIQSIINNSPWNIWQKHSYFKSHCQKYQISRKQFQVEQLSINGLTLRSICKKLWTDICSLYPAGKASLGDYLTDDLMK